MREYGSKFWIHVFDELLVEDDPVIDGVCGEDEVVGSWASLGCDGFWIAEEGEEEHLENLIELVASLFGIGREGS